MAWVAVRALEGLNRPRSAAVALALQLQLLESLPETGEYDLPLDELKYEDLAKLSGEPEKWRIRTKRDRMQENQAAGREKSAGTK